MKTRIGSILAVLLLSLFPFFGSVSAQTQEPVLFSDDFSTQKNWVDESEGRTYYDEENQYLVWNANWQTPGRYYVQIDADASKIHVSYRYLVTSSAGTGRIYFGLAESLQGAFNAQNQPTGAYVGTATWEDATVYPVYAQAYYSDREVYGGWRAGDPATYIDYQGYNVWYRVEYDIDGTAWYLEVYDDQDNQVNRLSGTLPAAHSYYRYFLIYNDDNQEYQDINGYIDDLVIYGQPYTGGY